MFENVEKFSGLHYEICFTVYTGHKIDQEQRTFITQANNYADALRKFIAWANNGEEKIERNRYGIPPKKARPLKFEQSPVTEDCVVSITKWNY